MADENRYGEYECPAADCRAVFTKSNRRDRHYRRVHSNTDADQSDGHAPRLSREELLNPD